MIPAQEIQNCVGSAVLIALSLYLGSKYSFSLVFALWALAIGTAFGVVTYF